MTGGGRVGDLIRHVVFPRMQNLRLPGTRVSAAEGVAPGLRSSELVIKSRIPGGLAGTLCPNPVLHDGLRFDEMVGNRFVLITSPSLTECRSETSSAATEPRSCSPLPVANLAAGCAKATPGPQWCGRTARSCKPVATSKRFGEPGRRFTESRAPLTTSSTRPN